MKQENKQGGNLQMTNCPFYRTSDCDLRDCHHSNNPEHCYLYKRSERLNAENPARRVTPNGVINIILDTISKVERDVVWEALGMKD